MTGGVWGAAVANVVERSRKGRQQIKGARERRREVRLAQARWCIPSVVRVRRWETCAVAMRHGIGGIVVWTGRGEAAAHGERPEAEVEERNVLATGFEIRCASFTRVRVY